MTQHWHLLRGGEQRTDGTDAESCYINTLVIQFASLIFFISASETNLQDGSIDIQFTWKCVPDSDMCRDYSDLDNYGWIIFAILMTANLGKDWINGSKLIYHSSRIRHPVGSRVRYFIGGISMCSIALYALYVSCRNDPLP